MTFEPLRLYEAAQLRRDAAAGFYNHNVRLDTDDGPVIVRIPIPGAATMDLSIWHEADVLAAVSPHLTAIPRVRYVSGEPPFQIHDFVEGDLLDMVAPRGTRLSSRVLDDIVAFFGELARIPTTVLPATPAGWPVDADTPGFANRLSAVTDTVYATHHREFERLFADLGIPADPLAAVREQWMLLTPRPFRLVHADIHRKNMIDTGKLIVFLDWELAVLGDPVYDLAVHAHKMAYLPDEQDTVIRGWVQAVPADCATNVTADLTAYLTHERIKSAIVDTVRYTTLVESGTLNTEQERRLIEKLSSKLNSAYRSWGLDRSCSPSSVEEAIRHRAS